MSKTSTKKLIEEIESLPVEERAVVAESVLQTLNPVESETQTKWIESAEKRLQEIKSGKVKVVPGNEVFERIQRIFSK